MSEYSRSVCKILAKIFRNWSIDCGRLFWFPPKMSYIILKLFATDQSFADKTIREWLISDRKVLAHEGMCPFSCKIYFLRLKNHSCMTLFASDKSIADNCNYWRAKFYPLFGVNIPRIFFFSTFLIPMQYS